MTRLAPILRSALHQLVVNHQWVIAGAVIWLSATMLREQPFYQLRFTFDGAASGMFEVYYFDEGGHAEEGNRARAAIGAPAGRRYVIPIPVQRIKAIRIHPGQPSGQGGIRDVAVVDDSGRVAAVAAFAEDPEPHDLTVVGRTASGIDYVTGPAPADPFVYFALNRSLDLTRMARLEALRRAVITGLLSILAILVARRAAMAGSPHVAAVIDWAVSHQAALITVLGLAWAALAWVLLFEWSARMRSMGWNAIEFAIAANLVENGRFAIGPLFPPALWRPPLAPMLLVTAERLSLHPLLAFQVLTATATAAFVYSMYTCGRMIGGTVMASLGAILTLTLPATSLVLLTSVHGISHIAMWLVLGPAVALSLRIIIESSRGEVRVSGSRLALAGGLWGACTLARPDTVFVACLFFGTCGWILKSKRQLALVTVPLAAFLSIYAPYQLWLAREARAHGLLARERIYQFYASQGWSAPKHQTGDTEADGYAYAIELYGTPEDNTFSIVRAVARNPGALAIRVRANLRQLWNALSGRSLFLPPVQILAIGALPVLFRAWRRGPREKARALTWAALSFCAIGYLLPLHVDPRYLTIAAPFAIILALFALQAGLTVAHGPWRTVAAVTVGAMSLAAALLPNSPWSIPGRLVPSHLDLGPVEELAAAFNKLTRPTDAERAGMYVAVSFHDVATRPPEDVFMFYYFTRTTVALGTSNDALYPRNRIFSYRNCHPTHAVVRPGAVDALVGRELGRIQAPQLGEYVVVRLADGDATCEG